MTLPDVHMYFHKEVTVRRSRLQENSCKETQEKYGNHREAGHPPTCDIAPRCPGSHRINLEMAGRPTAFHR